MDAAAQPSIDDTFVVAAGGRRLALVCWGTGSPTVLLETGGANIEEWTGSGIVDELVGRARVCAYDRAGTGRSDAAPDERRDADDVVVLDTPAPSAEFTEKSEPGLVWDSPGNTEHLDVVHGFENRFAEEPPRFDVPLLVVTPVPGEGSVENESFWLQASADARQVALSCGDEPTDGPCATRVAAFVGRLGANRPE